MKKIYCVLIFVAYVFVGCGVKKDPIYISPDTNTTKPAKPTKNK